MIRLLALLCSLLPPSLLPAADAPNPLAIRLFAETRGIQAGGTFFVGLHLRHPAGAHTYWKHPGIVGLATQVEWELPPGFVAGPIQWPAPEIVTMAIYQAQGYHGETLLLIPLTAPAGLADKPVTLTAKVSWMCCAKTCHPAAKVPLSVTLPVTATAELDPATRPLFAKFRALVPQRDPAWQATVKRDQHRILLTLRPPGTQAPASSPAGIRFFTADGQVDSNQPQPIELLPDGGIRLTLALSESAPPAPATLPGVLGFPNGWPAGGKPFAIEIDPAY
jgi:thiol:disulfide interchange protein DsbD